MHLQEDAAARVETVGTMTPVGALVVVVDGLVVVGSVQTTNIIQCLYFVGYDHYVEY